MLRQKIRVIVNIIVMTMPGMVLAANPSEGSATTKVNYSPAGQNNAEKGAEGVKEQGPFVFSAPPRESQQASIETYAPIAEYLSKVLGKEVTYKYPGNWFSYQADMQKGNYDLIFDGPHFNSWRSAKLQHNVLARFPGELTFVVAVKKGSDSITDLKQLSGRTVCGMNPPNLGTLTLLSQFDNPARQPVIVNAEGWENIYKSLMADKCSAAVLPIKNLEKYDRGTFTKVIFKAKPLPNQAFSAGPRISSEDQAKIVQALVVQKASGPTAKLREIYAIDGNLVPASKQEYAGLGKWLKDTRGY